MYVNSVKCLKLALRIRPEAHVEMCLTSCVNVINPETLTVHAVLRAHLNQHRSVYILNRTN